MSTLVIIVASAFGDWALHWRYTRSPMRSLGHLVARSPSKCLPNGVRRLDQK